LKTIKNPTVTPRLGHGIQFLNLKSEINFASESRRPPFSPIMNAAKIVWKLKNRDRRILRPLEKPWQYRRNILI